MSDHRLTTASVLPVAGESELLRGALDALRAQGRPLDEIIIVDDSPDQSLTPSDGVRTLRSGGRGPYAARNMGWRATNADVVLFLDVRSRPRSNWSQRLTESFADPEVAVVGSEVRIRGGNTLGAEASERHQFFELRKYTTDGFFRPYFPTCNLAVRRTDLEAVDGFSAVRSGGDADLCWRVLSKPGRRFEAIEEVLAEWVPRDRVRGYLEQNFRYGRSNRALRAMWEAHGAPQRTPSPYRILLRPIAGVAVRAGLAAAQRDRGDLLAELRKAARLAFEVGYRSGSRTAGFSDATTPGSRSTIPNR